MPYPLIYALMILTSSCNPASEERTEVSQILDSAFYFQESVAHIPVIEVCGLDSSDRVCFQSTYTIFNDSVFLHQYTQNNDWYFWDEEWYYVMQLSLPYPDKWNELLLAVGNDSGEIQCEYLQSYYLSISSQMHRATGKFEFLKITDSVLVFREDIRLLVTENNQRPFILHYDGVETAFRSDKNGMLYPPEVPRMRRRVIR